MEKLLFFIGLLSISTIFAQVGIGTISPNASAKLDITATDKGLLIPRVALTATNSALPVSLPTESLLIYNTATASSGATAVAPGYYYWNSTQWERLETNGNSWKISGNSGTNTATNFIGTTDAQSLIFKTNNTERMRILTNGNVGIGTSNPTSKLFVSLPSGLTNVGIGIYNRNYSGTNGLKTGLLNIVNPEGTGSHIGIRNFVDLNPASNANGVGVDNRLVVSGTGSHVANKNFLQINGTTASLNNYATHNIISISNPTNQSIIYGEYTDVGYNRGTSYGAYKVMKSHNAYYSDMFGDYNSMEGTGHGRIYGIFTKIKVSGNGTKYGLYNSFDNVVGRKTGVYNYFPNGNANGEIFATRNMIYNDGTGPKFGTYNYISSSAGQLAGSYNHLTTQPTNGSTAYGVYSFVTSVGTGRHYGGYFRADGTSNYGIYSRNSYIDGWAGYFIGRGYFSGDLGIGINNPTERLQVISDRILLQNNTATMYCSKNTGTNYGFELIGSYPGFGASVTRSIVLGGYNVNNANGQGFDSANRVQCGGGAAATLPIYATGFVTASSATFKKNISDLKYGLKEILKMRPVTYKYTFDKTNLYKVGFIAEEMSEIIPEVVAHLDSEGNEVTRDNGNATGMDYSQMTAVLVNAIKEQQVQIEELKKEIQLLKQ